MVLLRQRESTGTSAPFGYPSYLPLWKRGWFLWESARLQWVESSCASRMASGENKTFGLLSRATTTPTAPQRGRTQTHHTHAVRADVGPECLVVSGSCFLIELVGWKVAQIFPGQAQRW